MCGIFGILTSASSKFSNDGIFNALKILIRESQSRGKDSSGLVIRDILKREYVVSRGALPLDLLCKLPEIKTTLEGYFKDIESSPKMTRLVAGHSRLVTNGSQLSDDNNQPVLAAGLITIHNGIIVNDKELWCDNPQLMREFDIDTEILPKLIRNHLDLGIDYSTAIQCAIDQCVGTVSSAVISPELSSLSLNTNNGSLYVITDFSTLLCFASESYALKCVLKEFGNQSSDLALFQIKPDESVLCNFKSELSVGIVKNSSSSNAIPTVSHTDVFPVYVRNYSTKIRQELVRDVCEIAKSPESNSAAKLLEDNRDHIYNMKRCSRCILPFTFPFINFDNNGVCNYCKNYKIRNRPKPISELLDLIKPYRKARGQIDCIVPFSGGRDSTFALHFVKEVLELNPIAFTYDWGMVTDLGRRNIARVCGKLKVENVIVAADIHWKRQNINKNLSAWLNRPNLGMIPLFMAGDKYFYYFIERLKRKIGVDLNIWGINPMENTDFKVGFLGVPPDFGKRHIYSLSLNRKLKLFWGVGKAIASNPGYLNSTLSDTLGSFFARSIMPHRDYYHLFDYVQWDEKELNRLILNDYDWERAIDTDTTWRIGDGTAAFYNYAYFTVAGFSEHDTFRSNQIREGVLDREEALRLVYEENHPRYPTIRWYLDSVNIDYTSAIRSINAMNKLYRI